jgi:hypothetical protein
MLHQKKGIIKKRLLATISGVVLLGLFFFVQPLFAVTSSWMATGSYTGNGTSQSISNLGFQPDVVWIKADSASYPGAISTSTMGSDQTKNANGTGTLHTGSVTSLDTDGFSVGSGTDVNADTVTYYWTAFDANTDMVVNSYSGNGGATQAISGVGFSPDYVIILGDNGTYAYNRTTYGGSYARRMRNSGESTDAIISLDSDGFTAGDGTDDSQGNMNANGVDYHFIAFNEATGKIDVNTYVGGTPSDDRDITGVGFQPEFVVIQDYLSDYDLFLKSDKMPVASALNSRAALGTNLIQALISDGFQVGSASQVNNDSVNYAFVAFNITVAGGNSVDYTQDANIESWWYLDESSGTRYDGSGNDNDLTDNNAVTLYGRPTNPVKEGAGAASFAGGSSQSLTKTDNASLSITGNLTLVAWIRPTSVSGDNAIMGKSDGASDRSYYFYLDAGNLKAKISPTGSGAAQPLGVTTLSTNTWYHVALVYNGTDIRLYLDGVLDANGASNPLTYSSGIHDSSTAFAIGARGDGADYFDGQIDEVAVFNRALTADEISSVYENGLNGATRMRPDAAEPPVPYFGRSIGEDTGTVYGTGTVTLNQGSRRATFSVSII